jgi:hypothetical protein
MKYVSIAESRAGRQPGPRASELKGRALEEALKAAGLPSTGTADEKRAALAALEADVTPQPAAKPAPISSATPAANTTDGGSFASNTEGES